MSLACFNPRPCGWLSELLDARTLASLQFTSLAICFTHGQTNTDIMYIIFSHVLGQREPDSDVGAHHHVFQYQRPPTKDKLHEDERYMVIVKYVWQWHVLMIIRFIFNLLMPFMEVCIVVRKETLRLDNAPINHHGQARKSNQNHIIKIPHHNRPSFQVKWRGQPSLRRTS